MNKYRKRNTVMRVICLVLAGGMIITAFMSMLIYLL